MRRKAIKYRQSWHDSITEPELLVSMYAWTAHVAHSAQQNSRSR